MVVEEPAEEVVPVEGEEPNPSEVDHEPAMNETGGVPVNEQGEMMNGETLSKALNTQKRKRKYKVLFSAGWL